MRFWCLTSLICVLVIGCSQPESVQTRTLSGSHKEIIRICSEEHNLDVIVTPLGQTVWIYLPLEEDLLQMKATPKGPLSSDQASTSPSIKFLDGWYADGRFNLKYDIVPSKGYAKDYGYTSQFSEPFQAAQRNILASISRVYSPLSSSTDKPDVPDFFVIVMADIANGLESRVLLNFEDLKRAYVDQSFHGEYAKRVISEQPTGNQEIIGNTEGSHIDYKEILWPEFLAKQMIFRINFKYQRSSFLPSDDTRRELLTIAADTISAYDFTDFASIELQDLNARATFRFTPEDLAQYASEPSEGRLIHIQFQ